MFELKVTGETIAELKQNIAGLIMMIEEEANVPTKTTKKKTAKKSIKKKAAIKPPSVEEEVPQEEEVKEEVEEEVPQEDALAALQKVNSMKGIATAKEILNKFGAKRMSEVTPAQYGAFIGACDEVLG